MIHFTKYFMIYEQKGPALPVEIFFEKMSVQKNVIPIGPAV